jgi:hypothetical protein
MLASVWSSRPPSAATMMICFWIQRQHADGKLEICLVLVWRIGLDLHAILFEFLTAFLFGRIHDRR